MYVRRRPTSNTARQARSACRGRSPKGQLALAKRAAAGEQRQSAFDLAAAGDVKRSARPERLVGRTLAGEIEVPAWRHPADHAERLLRTAVVHPAGDDAVAADREIEAPT